ncbi:hypothetical protein FQZ97_913130 [compost metagenome]
MVRPNRYAEQQSQDDQRPGGSDPELTQREHGQCNQHEYIKCFSAQLVGKQTANKTAQEHAHQRRRRNHAFLQRTHLQRLADLGHYDADDAQDVAIQKWGAGGIDCQLLMKAVQRCIF